MPDITDDFKRQADEEHMTIRGSAKAEEAALSFAQIIADLSVEYDEMSITRHGLGAEKYGPGKFLVVDTIQEALEEIVDLGNYVRYTFIKLRLLQESIAQSLPPEGLETGFIKAKTATSVKEK